MMTDVLQTITYGLLAVYCCLTLFYIGHWYGRAVLKRSEKFEHLILGAAILAHATLVFIPLLQGEVLDLGLGRALSLIVWLILLFYWTGRFFYRVEGLQLFILPLAIFAMVSELIFPSSHFSYSIRNPLFLSHLLVSLLAYSLFAVAAIIASAMLFLESALHQHRSSRLLAYLPPLLSLERMMFQVIKVAYGFLTLSLISGVFFSEAVFGKPAVLTHKTVFAGIAWLVYGGVLWGRMKYGWRGKKASGWIVFGFVLLLLGYIGSKFILEVILRR